MKKWLAILFILLSAKEFTQTKTITFKQTAAKG